MIRASHVKLNVLGLARVNAARALRGQPLLETSQVEVAPLGAEANVLQPKIADGTFVIKNSSEAVGLQAKPTLTRDEESKIIGQVTTNWDFNTAKSLAESNLTKATKADKGTVYILAPNDGTARAIADAFAADKDVTKYFVTGQDAEKASVQYIIHGKQSMTVMKDVRTLAADAVTGPTPSSRLEPRRRPPPTTMARSMSRPSRPPS